MCLNPPGSCNTSLLSFDLMCSADLHLEVLTSSTAWKAFPNFQCLLYNLSQSSVRKVLSPWQAQAESEDVDLWDVIPMPLGCASPSPIKISWKTLPVPMRKALLLHSWSSSWKAESSWCWHLILTRWKHPGNWGIPLIFLQWLDTDEQVNKYVMSDNATLPPWKPDFI